MTTRYTVERMRDVLHYDPETGSFTWKKRIWTHCAIGRVAGTVTWTGHIHIGLDGYYCNAHQMAWAYMTGEWPLLEVDHKNCLKTDNRFDNLRLATDQQQSANRGASKNNQLGIKGVRIAHANVNKAVRYRARIRVNNKLIHLGYYSTPEVASAAYHEAAVNYFGEFARSA